MLMGAFESLTLSPVWAGVFIGLAAVVLASIGVMAFKGRRKPAKTAKKSPVPLFSSIPELNKAIEFTGFAYDQVSDIFYSLMNPWQRDYGYCRFYDEAAATLSMIIDAEPIYFEYGGKQWLIEFWKGQYGMTTGGEVGVYNTDSKDKDLIGSLIDWNGKLYNSVPDHERLDISMILYKNGRPLFSRREVHWWLTGFVLGEFSQPDELSMDIGIVFPDVEMRDAFVEGLRKTGYSEQQYVIKKLGVGIHYSKPHSPLPLTRTKLTDSITQNRNRELCELYQKITGPYNSMIDKINALRQQNEQLFNQAINIGKPKELFLSLNKIIG
ncbi:MAG: DUF4474 domain-containing protein [Oscillospiraceae bacterium]|nr:DUF4474 domain-containing protein [Oscillospiraceae bacterium]